MSVTPDPIALKKIQNKGLKAIFAKVEELDFYDVQDRTIYMFEVIEHLANPVWALRHLKYLKVQKIVFTVPYLKTSRVGLHHLRNGKGEDSLESTHVFELCPEDWKLLFEYTGWEIQGDSVYYQYPRNWLTNWLWKRFWTLIDYEGFYGGVLVNKREMEK